MKPIMTKTKARQWLKAVISLREYYEGKNDKWKNRCPLCPISRHDNSTDCGCLWVYFEGNSCEWWKTGICRKRENRTTEWVAKSIPRLRRWERRLRRIINKKDR